MSPEDPAGAEAPVEEQVVGVLKYCDVCEEKTVHVDGVCRDHQIRRVRRKPAAVAAPAQEVMMRRLPRPARPAAAVAADPSAPVRRRVAAKPKRTSRVRYVMALVLIVGFVVASGFFHVIHGTGTSVHVCAKHGWSLADTVVNLDDYRPGGDPLPWKLEAALAECQLPVVPR